MPATYSSSGIMRLCINVEPSKGIVWPFILTEINPERHLHTANYLYADGHVETIGVETVHEWVQNDIQNGTNFAQPVK